MECKNLVNLLECTKEKSAGITFINNSKQEEFMSYEEVYSLGKAVLHGLNTSGLRKGDKLVFQLDNSKNFIIAFWACIMGGIIPVPVTIGTNDELKNKVFSVLDILESSFLLTERNLLQGIDSFQKQSSSLKINNMQIQAIIIEDLLSTNEDGTVIRTIEDDIAFIQFSSGSTGNPKGIVLTHKNLLSNVNAIIQGIKLNKNDKCLNWMPLTHDMGLIGFHLSALAVGIPQFIIHTFAFIKRPVLWMDKIHEHRITVTASPNFGYLFFLKGLKPDKAYNWDLSCIRLMINGAEPISADACSHFTEKLEKYNFCGNAFFNVYGLAEASLAVSFPPLGEGVKYLLIKRDSLKIGSKIEVYDENSNITPVKLVDLGSAVNDCEVRICDASGEPLADDVVGHIHIKGANVTKGYYNVDSLSVISSDGWLNTGDIGFICNGRVFVCGRAKDIIFINGQNIYPSDIEHIIERECDVKHGSVVATSAYCESAGRDIILLFVIFRGKIEEIVDLEGKIRRMVAMKMEIILDEVIPVHRFPKTTSGKIMRYELSDKFQKGEYTAQINELKQVKAASRNLYHNDRAEPLDRKQVIKKLKMLAYETLGFEIEDLDKSLLEYGVSSVRIIPLTAQIEETCGISLPVSTILDYPSINELASFMLNKKDCPDTIPSHEIQIEANQDIAIIGMGCKFPDGADDINLYWEKLVQGYDAITDVPDERYDLKKYSLNSNENIRGGFLRDIDLFDSNLFGIIPREAKWMDPQHRLLLEVTHEALVNAAIDINSTKGKNIGAFVGMSTDDYLDIVRSQVEVEQIEHNAVSGNMKSVAAGRLGYVFDWHGPMVTVDTACSSSLVAIHTAIQSIILNECYMAIAGGVNVLLSPKGFIGLNKMNALSSDGRCKSFDDSANGYVRSEGCGMVLLKKLQDAIKDNDNIVAVIKGSAINHDGRGSGLVAPNGKAQIKVISDALKKSNVAKENISYIEAHGSGTKLGDPQEINALGEVYKNVDNKIVVGSVKTNIGHTESAAGVAGLIKLALSMKHNLMLGNIHMTLPNQLIDWANTPFTVNSKNLDWASDVNGMFAGISSFGLSGTNVHMILSKPPSLLNISQNVERMNLFTISAKSKENLTNDLKSFYTYLGNSRDSLEDICYTTNRGRSSGQYRFGTVASSKSALQQSINNYLERCNATPLPSSDKKQIVFVFSDADVTLLGPAIKELTRDSYFRAAISECEKIISNFTSYSIEDMLSNSASVDELHKTFAKLAIEYGLVKVLESFGVEPDCVIGYGDGEYLAACVASIITLEQMFELVYAKYKGNYELVFAKTLFNNKSIKMMYPTSDKYSVYELGYWNKKRLSANAFQRQIYELSRSYSIFVEIGIEASLANIAQYSEILKGSVITSTLKSTADGYKQVGHALMLLYENGVDIAFSNRNIEGRKIIQLPPMSMSRKSYWFNKP